MRPERRQVAIRLCSGVMLPQHDHVDGNRPWNRTEAEKGSSLRCDFESLVSTSVYSRVQKKNSWSDTHHCRGNREGDGASNPKHGQLSTGWDCARSQPDSGDTKRLRFCRHRRCGCQSVDGVIPVALTVVVRFMFRLPAGTITKGGVIDRKIHRLDRW